MYDTLKIIRYGYKKVPLPEGRSQQARETVYIMTVFRAFFIIQKEGEKLGFLNKIFRARPAPEKMARIDVMNGNQAVFTPFSGNAYESDIFRSAVDAIARNASKLKPCHVVEINGARKVGSNDLNRILQVRPNPYMTAYDLIYKLVTHYYLYNNAFAYLQKNDKGNLTGIYPLSPQQMEYLTDATGQLYCKFTFSGGKELILRFDEVFTIRRFFNSNDLLGDSNSAIFPTLDLAHTQNQGLESVIKSSATIRGILKYTQVLSPEKLKQEKDAFVADYLNISNSGGVAVIDSKAEYIPLNNNIHSSIIDDKQLQAIKIKIYEYLGVSESIVNSTYSENDWSAFYESVIEPLALQFSLELTDKIFTAREQAFGNSIILTSNRLQFANNQTKINILKELLPMGLFTLDDGREILSLPPIGGEEGKKRLQSLNYVDQKKANLYQVGGGADEGNQKHRDTKQ